jgi:hypothetical protein
MEQPNTKLIATDTNFNINHPARTGKKISLYHIKGTGFIIIKESINYIESVDEDTAKEHYKHCQRKYQKFPKTE